jgi:oxygen-dependent protoporphyrinogen oxidase
LVLAVPAREGGALLSELDPEAAKEMAAVDYAPVVSVSLGVDPTRVRQPLQGFGFLVPSREGGALLGCLFPSCLFPGRAPSGRTLLTALLGGTRRPDLIEMGEAELVACVHDELDRFLGLRDTPEWLAVTRWPRAVAQPGPDHPRLLQRVRGRLAAFPRLVLAGSYLEGVAVSDAVEAGVRAAACIAPREP